MRKQPPYFPFIALLLVAFILAVPSSGQQTPRPSSKQAVAQKIFSNNDPDLFGTKTFIRNIGQYGKNLKGQEDMGAILYGYEGLGMPVLFTSKGVIHLQRKMEGPSPLEKEKEEYRERKRGKGGIPEEEIEEQKVIDQVITMQWLNANADVQLIGEDPSNAFHSYASIPKRAPVYKRIVYKNLYPGIDAVYYFNRANTPGYEFSLLLNAGADLNAVKLKIGGDAKKTSMDSEGNLLVESGIGGVSFTIPVSYYGTNISEAHASGIRSSFQIEKNTISFSLPSGYDHLRPVVIDPFVTGTANLTGLNAGKAKDVDYDYAGNVYVTGGGDPNIHRLAKYNAAGVLQWTFNGSLTIPSWTFGTYWGGWMVEKPTGNVYLGQGFNPATGFQVIRVNTSGLYDNYITNANPNFREAWKMVWSCNNGSPQILVAGGGTNSNINFGVFTPPSTSIGSLNVTGIPYSGSTGWAQDIVDFIIDPLTNDMYTLYGSLIGTPSLTNKIYKNTAPYNAASVAWNVASGFTTVQEIANRPYLAGGQIDNSANIFAINSSYLFYWDGKNLKAFNKSTGAAVGTPLTTANIALMQGGIIADACNNVFAGDANGTIKVYQFNGSTFDDAAAPDIAIPGFAGKAVYDLAYDESKKLLYASGDGFIASFDVSSYCPATQYTLAVTPDCINSSATVTVNPTAPAGSTITYVLYNGSTQVASNTTGVFPGLAPNSSYAVIATINLACSGTQASTSFQLPGPVISVNTTNASCGNNSGVITVNASGGIAPYSYSIDGTNFQSGNSFTGLATGIYNLIVKDANGCRSNQTVTITNSNGPQVSVTSTNANCSNNNGSINVTASGSASPYQYSINGGTFQPGSSFTGLTGGNYTISVKDANGCTNSVAVAITTSSSPSIIATPATASCGSANGSITAFGTGGTPPLQYSVNGVNFQANNIFTNLGPGNYTVTVKDANGCTQSTTVTIDNSVAPTVTATATSAACNNSNGSITANGNGGIAPLQYSINGLSYQASNIFTGLAAGSYTVFVRDNAGCTNTFSISVGSSNAPAVTAASTPTACNTNTGTITASATGGSPGYTYSINGIVFQSGNIFNTLAAGNYVVCVKDINGCIGTATVIVGNSGGPSLSATTTPTSCNSNTGIITANGTGGAAPLTFSIDGTNYQAGNSFTGLATGTYTVYVKDVNGCIKTTTAVITNTSGLALMVSSLSSSCNANNGTITATATGGVLPLQYSINGTLYQASNIFPGLTNGSYTVYVKDANGCMVTKTVTVLASNGPSLALTIQQNATCGTASGVIKASGSAGIAPLSYSMDGGAFQTVNIFINVATGAHTVTVKDAAGCTSSQGVTITNSGAGSAPTDLTFVVKDALPCTGGTGRIKNLKGLPSGGGNTYVFSLDGGPFTTANQFTNVPVGIHTVTAKNESGCTITKLITIGSGTPATATATVTPTACNASNGTIKLTGVGVNTPYHASINNGSSWVTFNTTFTFTNLAAGTYPIIIADDADFTAGPPDVPGACLTTIYVAVPSTGGPSIATTQINPSCTSTFGSISASGMGGIAPYTYSINGGSFSAVGVFNNLSAGSYAVTVQDATGCTTGSNITLVNPSSPVVTAVIEPTSCNSPNGSIAASATGGVAPLEYSINGTTFQTSNSFTNLSPGNYTLYVKDVNGCYSTTTAVIANTPLPFVSAFTIAASCGNSDGSIVSTGSGGTVPYSFSIDGAVYQSSGTFGNLAGGVYTVYIKDARGCISTTAVTIASTGAVTPTFNAVAPVCSGAVLAPLPTTSLNGIVGSWSPALNTNATTVYTFTPGAGQCANTTTITITILPKPSPLVIYHN